jgi:hypothetical protein
MLRSRCYTVLCGSQFDEARLASAPTPTNEEIEDIWVTWTTSFLEEYSLTSLLLQDAKHTRSRDGVLCSFHSTLMPICSITPLLHDAWRGQSTYILPDGYTSMDGLDSNLPSTIWLPYMVTSCSGSFVWLSFRIGMVQCMGYVT